MKQSVLVADDSLTIQKVIKITLSNEPFELEECHEDKTLLDQVRSLSPEIVLLDFNLSDSKTGYDLVKEIKEIVPNSKILMLYGTFDTIDEDLLRSSGCSYHITKPFDGNKFIQLCRSMISDSLIENDEATQNFEIPDPIESELEDIDQIDEWVVNQPQVDEPEEILEIPSPIVQLKNPLEESMDEWSMEVPGFIEDKSIDIVGEIPAIILEEDIPEFKEEINKIPKNEDLSFPDEDDLSYPDELPEPISHLIPIDNLNLPNELVLETNTQMPLGSEGTETSEQIDSLKNMIQDEIDDEDLWEIDEYEESISEPVFEPLNHEDIEHIEDNNVYSLEHNMPSDFPEDVMNDEFLSSSEKIDVIQTSIPAASNALTKELEEKLVNQLFEKLKPLIMDKVEQFCLENVEKISWEVIPDLAENIIQKELAQITKKVMGEDEE